MWTMNNSVNSQISPLNNSTNNSSMERIKSSKSKNSTQDFSAKTSPIQFGFNFYFNNVKSSPFTPMNSPKEPYLKKNSNGNQKISASFVFRTSLEKSGFKIPPDQIIINNEIFNEYNNNLNFCYDDTNYVNIPVNTNYPMNNNNIINNIGNSNIINNIYPTITKVTNVKIISNNNDQISKNRNNEINLENKKENINHNILNVNIIDNENKKDLRDREQKINNEIQGNTDILQNKKTKVLFECSESNNNNGNDFSKNLLKKKRFRKNSEQIVLLSKFYNEHKNWSKKEIKEISKNIGLKENKIYKWLWDQKNKDYNKSTKFVINKNNN